MTSIPDIATLQESAKNVVRRAKKANTLKSLTPRIVRREIEKKLSLESECLDETVYKSAIKEAVAAVMAEGTGDTEKHGLDKAEATPSNKRKSISVGDPQSLSPKRAKPSDTTGASEDRIVMKGKGKRGLLTAKPRQDKEKKAGKSPGKVAISDEEEGEFDLKTKAKTNIFAHKDDSPTKSSKKHVPESDVKTKPELSVRSSKKGKGRIKEAKPHLAELPKSKNKSSDLSDEEEEEDEGLKPNASTSKTVSSKGDSPVKHESDADAKSDSELSVLIDESPKRKKASKGNKESKKTNKESSTKKVRKSTTESSKEDATIKRLKSLVVACGVRKAWSKEFKDLDTPSAQIQRLKKILTELGMKGRMSLEQAKAIRAKRELAQELEDVISYEKAVVGRDKEDAEESGESGDSGEEAGPSTKRKTAAHSIMAFLADQSDSE